MIVFQLNPEKLSRKTFTSGVAWLRIRLIPTGHQTHDGLVVVHYSGLTSGNNLRVFSRISKSSMCLRRPSRLDCNLQIVELL